MLYQKLTNNQKQKKLAVLIDPDKYSPESLTHTLDVCKYCQVDFILAGGSLVSKSIDQLISLVKEQTQIPVILFPGSLLQLSSKADGLLLLSLISGRNPEFLIGNHVIASPFLKKSGLEILPTGYMLVESGQTTSVEYISNTKPIPANKPEIAVATAIAGEMLGLKLIYLEAGSGAQKHVPLQMISDVKKNINIPLIVGGGIRTAEQLHDVYNAGADIVVLGNSIENSPDNLLKIVGYFNKN
jgi:phosphoglycerol geranylgeranyltransferase